MRCGDDLAVDPFEERPIGYRQVTEKTPGAGQIITVYHVPAGADENAAVDGAAAGIAWARPVVGVARRTYVSPISGSTNCPTIAPLYAGTGLYPFAPATNYDFRRGLLQSVTYKAEPVGNSPAVTVRQETFTYQYRNVAPALPAVIGLTYEQLINGQYNTYAYAKYPILTDFLYTVRQKTQTIPTGQGTNQSVTWYRYNNQGWLAAQAQSNSDGKYYRTRYKYLTDYPLTGPAVEARFQAMQQRLTLSGEQISADLVETISEVVSAGGEVRFAGATLNTFTPANQSSPTRPYQTLRWQPAAPLPLTSYDSTQVSTTATGGRELRVSNNFRIASTLLEVNERLLPLSTRLEAGRQLASVQLGYNGTMPVLQIANALSSEALFSDFESDKSLSFKAYNSNGQQLTPASQAARTGQAGVELSNGAYLNSYLPVSSAASYRLSFWARTSNGGTITVSVAGGVGGTPPTSQTIPVLAAAGKWQLYEATINLSAIPRTARGSYTLKLLSNLPVQLDDVLFVPADATAASTTYDLTKGKTSETDGRGRTVTYEYGVQGDLARVRDHNGAIVKQIDKVVAGQSSAIAPAITISENQIEGETITFTATSCGDLEYSWDFGDNTTTGFSTAATATHVYNIVGREQSFRITMRARDRSQGKVYTAPGFITIRAVPFVVSSCTNGVTAIDNCGLVADVLENTCDPSLPPAP
ncbi:MAG TPA: PKD domain-containing protein, partial [Hymenobacter sp.]|nr:PKD domain-containing protein [Hymenobacter sp.]